MHIYIYIYIHTYIHTYILHFHARWGQRRAAEGEREGGGGRAQPVQDQEPLKAS